VIGPRDAGKTTFCQGLLGKSLEVSGNGNVKVLQTKNITTAALKGPMLCFFYRNGVFVQNIASF
jgi:ABC-type multidrug transport system ATPase subunit